MFNINEVHQNFKEENSNVKVGLILFFTLTTKRYILAGDHQNVKLMLKSRNIANLTPGTELVQIITPSPQYDVVLSNTEVPFRDHQMSVVDLVLV